MLEKYSQAQSDPDLLALRDEIALVDVRLSELLEQLNSGGGMEDWSRVHDAWRNFQELSNAQEPATTAERDRIRERMGETIRQLNQIISGGHRNISLWHEIRDTLEDRRRLVTTEAKRLADMNQMISSERQMALIYRLLAILKERITDVDILAAISGDIRAEITRNISE
jgi:hypothetical protein